MYFVSFVQNLVYDLQTIIRSATNINYRFVMVILHNSVDIPFLYSWNLPPRQQWIVYCC